MQKLDLRLRPLERLRHTLPPWGVELVWGFAHYVCRLLAYHYFELVIWYLFFRLEDVSYSFGMTLNCLGRYLSSHF